MKKIILSAAIAFTVLTTSNAVAQQGFGTNTPDRSAAVDIVSNKRGLLIPRINLTKTTEAGPVAKPENALFVYNKATVADVTPGFYYWEAKDNTAASKEEGLGRWVRFVSSTSGSAVTVSAGTNVVVTPTTNGHDTDYKVSVKAGNAAGQVLVTREVTVGGNTTLVSEWVNPEDFIKDTVVGVNGITVKENNGKVEVSLGGTPITTATELNLVDKGSLAIKGLEELSTTPENKFDATKHDIVVMGEDGILKVVSPKNLLDDAIKDGSIDGKKLTSKSIVVGTNGDKALLKDVNIEITPGDKEGMVMITTIENGVPTTTWVEAGSLGNTVTASNGLTKEGNDIKLGGKPITTATVLDVTATDASLAIKGLEELGATKVKGNNVVLADAEGVLRETSPENLIGDAIEGGSIKAKTLKGDGITVTAGDTVGTDSQVVSSLLKDVTLGIADNAITTSKIVDGAVTNSKIEAGSVSQEKLYAGTVDANGVKKPADLGSIPVAGADGIVTYKTLDTAVGAASLHTDGKIVIGDNQSSVVLAEKTVLAETTLSIKQNSISSVEITDGTVANVDLAPNAVSADKMTSNTTANGTKDPADKGQVPVADGKGGVTYEQITGELLNGKALTSGSISVFGGETALLDATKIDITGGETEGEVLVTSDVPMKDADGNTVVVNGKTVYETKWVKPGSLGNTVTASNGLTKTGNDIALGGTITKPAVLTIAPGVPGENGTVKDAGSLVIEGLNPADVKQTNKTVVVQADGKLATVDTAAKNVTVNKAGDVNISDNSVVNNYHPSMSEIVIEVTLGGTDTNLVLPAVDGTEGQTISIKIANTNEEHNGYLNIKADSTVLAYGAMPFQGWIIKSNGLKWIVVGRN